MSSVNEFMSAGPVRKFTCGARFGFLDRLFNRVSESDKAERLQKIRESIADTAIGRETLDFLAENETGVVFEKAKGYGFYAPEKNMIALNWKASDQDLALTLIHEARHARQDKTMGNTVIEMTPETLLKNGFMIEADACAAECVFAREKMANGDARYCEAQQKSPYAPMGQVFEQTFAETGDVGKARESAMLKWYDLPIKDVYADDYIRFMEIAEDKRVKDPFRISIPVEEMANKLCTDGQGKCYLSDPAVLNNPDKVCLEADQSKDMQRNIFAFCRAKQRGLEGLGLDKVFTRHYDDTYTRVLSDMNFEPSTPIRMARLKRANGR